MIGENHNIPNSKVKRILKKFLKLVIIKENVEVCEEIKLSNVPDVLYNNSGLKVTTPYIKYECAQKIPIDNPTDIQKTLYFDSLSDLFTINSLTIKGIIKA